LYKPADSINTTSPGRPTRLVAQLKTQAEVRPDLPIVSYEGTQVELAARDHAVPRVDAQLCRAASELPDARGGEAGFARETTVDR
jgi:hypothetical protein